MGVSGRKPSFPLGLQCPLTGDFRLHWEETNSIHMRDEQAKLSRRVVPHFVQLRAYMTLLFVLVEDNPTIRDNLIETLVELVGAELVMSAGGERDARIWFCLNKPWTVAILDLFILDGSGLG